MSMFVADRLLAIIARPVADEPAGLTEFIRIRGTPHQAIQNYGHATKSFRGADTHPTELAKIPGAH